MRTRARPCLGGCWRRRRAGSRSTRCPARASDSSAPRSCTRRSSCSSAESPSSPRTAAWSARGCSWRTPSGCATSASSSRTSPRSTCQLRSVSCNQRLNPRKKSSNAKRSQSARKKFVLTSNNLKRQLKETQDSKEPCRRNLSRNAKKLKQLCAEGKDRHPRGSSPSRRV